LRPPFPLTNNGPTVGWSREIISQVL
jgi:hypothetical protein